MKGSHTKIKRLFIVTLAAAICLVAVGLGGCREIIEHD
jgi:hypothetical protein